MPAVATLGSYRKNSFKIYIGVFVALALWLAYDGYFNQKFIEEHQENGKPNSTLTANRIAPFVFLPAALVLAIRWRMVKDKTIVADGKSLILADGSKIAYDSIEKIDKTKFEKSGYFIVTYKDDSGKEASLKLSDRHYDNLEGVLAELVAALKGPTA